MTSNTYDALPYADYTFPATHPEHLFTMSRLVGLDPPEFRSARVLEIGCARGANLIPMALDLPDATFFGVDLSPRQIDEGRAIVSRLGIANVALHAGSVLDLDTPPAWRDEPSWSGTFDYVICHGVYSWVPDTVRAGILRVCAQRLSPRGVAYVSYNVTAGWREGLALRERLARELDRAGDPAACVAVARAKLAHLRSEATARGDVFVVTEIDRLRDLEDSYVFHEYLEDSNVPVTFGEFDAAARAVGLEHVVDAELSRASHRALLDGRAPDAVSEQHADDAQRRRFRASLLARPTAVTRRPLRSEHIAGFHLATRAELAQDATEPSLRDDSALRFAWGTDTLVFESPIAKCAMVTLVEQARRPMPFATLVRRAAQRAGLHDEQRAVEQLAVAWRPLDLVLRGVVELSSSVARYVANAGPRPVGCPLARMQAEQTSVVTHRRHWQLELGDFERAVLTRLDGRHDRAAIALEIDAALRSGRLAIRDEHPTTIDALAERCDETLEFLAWNALLIG